MSNDDKGFTIVETMVTLIVAVIFVIALNTLFVTVIRSTASSRNRSEASTLAYSYLRTYAYPGADSSWFTCDSNTDLQQNANASGQAIPNASGTLTSSQTSLPQPVSYSVKALAPYGCAGTASSSPLMIRSTVTYGSEKLTVDHATYLERLR